MHIVRSQVHIARSQVNIARSYGVTFARTTYVLRGEKFGSHLGVDSNRQTCKMITPVSVSLYKLHNGLVDMIHL